MPEIVEINEEEAAKKQWTEQERLELAAKLDADLDAFINSLEKKRYEEGWPEDRWQEVNCFVVNCWKKKY